VRTDVRHEEEVKTPRRQGHRSFRSPRHRR
jgi:hypothetical protein